MNPDLFNLFNENLSNLDEREDSFNQISIPSEIKDNKQALSIISDIIYLRKIRLANSNIFSGNYLDIQPKIIDLKIQILFEKLFRFIDGLKIFEEKKLFFYFLFFIKPEQKNFCTQLNKYSFVEKIEYQKYYDLISYSKSLEQFNYFNSYVIHQININDEIYKVRLFTNKITQKNIYNIFIADSIGDNIFYSKLNNKIDYCFAVPGLTPQKFSQGFYSKLKEIVINNLSNIQNFNTKNKINFHIFINIGCGIKILLAQTKNNIDMKEISQFYNNIIQFGDENFIIRLNKFVIPLPKYLGIGVQGDDLRMINTDNLHRFNLLFENLEQTNLEPFKYFENVSALPENLRVHSREIHPKIIQNSF